jgi:Zn-dependent peptidase ImmA (M78 family)
LEAISQGENAAQQERYRLELGKGAIYDIVEPLSSQGIRVVGTQFPDEISGLFLNHSSMGMVILVNASHERTRQRFSYAHEYAHALFDQRRTVIISNADNASELVEVRANAFAAAFLMPKEGVEGLLRSMGKGGAGRNYLAVFDAIQEKVMEAQYRQPAASQKISAQVVAWIAYRFGVSFQVAVYRLQNLNCLKPHERDELLKAEQQGREYMRVLHLQDDSLTPQKLQDKELKASVARLAIEAYQREDISRGRLLDISKLLGLKGAQLLELAYTDPS